MILLLLLAFCSLFIEAFWDFLFFFYRGMVGKVFFCRPHVTILITTSAQVSFRRDTDLQWLKSSALMPEKINVHWGELAQNIKNWLRLTLDNSSSLLYLLGQSHRVFRMLSVGNALPWAPPTRSENRGFLLLRCPHFPPDTKPPTLAPENPPCWCF